MTRRRALIAALILTVLAVVFWQVVLNVAAVAAVTRIAWLRLRHLTGAKARPRSSWSALGRTAALMFAAWQTRWIKPHALKASVAASADGMPARPEGWDR